MATLRIPLTTPHASTVPRSSHTQARAAVAGFVARPVVHGSTVTHSFPERSGLLRTAERGRARARTQLCAASGVTITADSQAGVNDNPYAAVVFDMDGTMTVSNIDFKTMRERTGIPQGDLFTVMEKWENPDDIRRAMEVILEMEAEAQKTVELQPGLEELLTTLRDRGVKIGLVTRNTTDSVDHFFRLLGEQWRPVFEQVITREFQFVKPDKRLLLEVAAVWGMRPDQLLMVGDSREDVECGNAAGTGSCLIEGGGNELSSEAPPLGARPTFGVTSLSQLERLLTDTAAREAACEAAEAAAAGAGAPPPGIPFFDYLFLEGAVKAASCSYPRLGGAAGGLQASEYPGNSVLHLGCGEGGLTKLVASQGLATVGVEVGAAAVAKAQDRGLEAAVLAAPMTAASLASALGRRTFDVCLYHLPVGEGVAQDTCCPWSSSESLDAVWEVLNLGGRLGVECDLAGSEAAAALELLEGRGFVAAKWEGAEGGRVRAILEKPGLQSGRTVGFPG